MLTNSSLVIEDMIRRFEAGQSALPVYFYCTRSAAEPERSKPDKILASILRQLSCIQPDAPLLGPVIEKYRRQGEGFKSNGLNLDDSRDLIVRLIEDYSMTTIVVDALDECDPTMRQSLLDAFEHILKESAGLVKIFVSSRNDQDIVYTLRDYPNLDISSERNTADIEAYVKTETRRLVKTGQLLRNSRAKGEMTASIIDHVSSGADGMFRWASLQLDVLRALKRDEDIRIQLRRLPPKLEQLYLEVYNNLISVQGEFSQSIIGNTLKWLLCAKEELRASEFLMAVAANLNTSDGDISVDSLLELCNNFVVYDEGLNVFRFAHLSVREFLETRPEFAKVSCYSLAAECCLLQIFASSNCPETERFMSDVHRLRLRGAPGCTDTSQCEKFLEYANRFWMEYCRLIPRSYRSDDTDFGRIFQFFLSDKLGSNSPLNLWVQWYCSRVLNGWEPAAAVKLQDFLTSCSESLSRSFLVATYFGFSEIVSFYTKDRGLSDDLKDKGVLLAAMAARYEAFDILRENRENWSMTEPVLSYAIRTSDEERLVLLLDKVHDAMITHGILAAVVEDQDDWKMTVLLDRYPGMTITEEVLDTAMEYASLDSFRLLLDRSMEPRITRGMLKIPGIPKSLIIKPIADSYVEKMKLLLDKVGEPDLTPYLVASAAEFSDEELIEAMLKKGAASNITDEVMVEAAQRGREVFHLMLRYGGKLTETMLDDAAARCDARAWQMLLEQGYESSVSVKRLKLAALNNSHGDAVLSILLNHTDDTFLANELAELVQDVARISWSNNTLRQLLDRVKSSEISQDMLSAANFNDWPDRLGRVKMFLERSSELRITEDMLLVAAADGNDGVELTQMFLEREGEVEISEYVLMAAARNRYQRYQTMQLLLERNGAADVTEDVLLCAVQHSNVDFVQELLEHSEARVITGCLLEAAAANEICGGELLKLLLARADLTGFPEDLLIEAVGNGGNGIEVLLLLEENYGRIRMSEDLLVKCVRRAAPKTIELLLSRTDRTQITKEVLISALRCDSDYITRGVAGKSLHVPITTDILEVAAEYSETDVFRFLWNRYRRSSVPESLINAAAKNLCPSGTDSPTQFEFLLHEADCVDIGEQTIIAIVGNTWHASSYFQLLLQRGLRADITAGGPNTLLMHGSIKIKCSSASPLKLSKDMKVTEDMFRIAASLGNEYLLEQLSKFCGLESTPERWLDIARLHNSAYWAQNDLLKTLIGRGSDPDVASPHGATPLVQAAWKGNEVGVQLLLSAGALPDGGPTLKYSPLCWAVAYGHYDVVKILVDAGASINFRDEEGRTPSMIAKQYRHFRVLKYLEERRIKQEGAGREVSEST